MKFVLRVLALIALTLFTLKATPGRATDATDPRIVFVNEYLRELSAQESLRENAVTELTAASTAEDQLASDSYRNHFGIRRGAV